MHAVGLVLSRAGYQVMLLCGEPGVKWCGKLGLGVMCGAKVDGHVRCMVGIAVWGECMEIGNLGRWAWIIAAVYNSGKILESFQLPLPCNLSWWNLFAFLYGSVLNLGGMLLRSQSINVSFPASLVSRTWNANSLLALFGQLDLVCCSRFICSTSINWWRFLCVKSFEGIKTEEFRFSFLTRGVGRWQLLLFREGKINCISRIKVKGLLQTTRGLQKFFFPEKYPQPHCFDSLFVFVSGFPAILAILLVQKCEPFSVGCGCQLLCPERKVILVAKCNQKATCTRSQLFLAKPAAEERHQACCLLLCHTRSDLPWHKCSLTPETNSSCQLVSSSASFYAQILQWKATQNYCAAMYETPGSFLSQVVQAFPGDQTHDALNESCSRKIKLKTMWKLEMWTQGITRWVDKNDCVLKTVQRENQIHAHSDTRKTKSGVHSKSWSQNCVLIQRRKGGLILLHILSARIFAATANGSFLQPLHGAGCFAHYAWPNLFVTKGDQHDGRHQKSVGGSTFCSAEPPERHSQQTFLCFLDVRSIENISTDLTTPYTGFWWRM